jgi:ABC-2 type transport system permease protein
MPLFFARNAIYPLSMMPDWLRAVAVVNPLICQVDALRRLMIAQAESPFGLATDFAVQIGALFLLTLVATRFYPRIIN